ncbi:MAG: hypothetical protein C0403_18090, partial [Desulfobacterium sp.]|nr:hypothetical protein [Desulfobacterium sp.]
NFIHDGLKKTIVDPDGKEKSEIVDYLGRLVEVDEHSGNSTRYTYNEAGDLLRVEDALGNITEMQYNALGQKEYMNDPDMGEWNYRYTLNGQLIEQEDNRMPRVRTSFTFDSLNRVTRKIFSNGDKTVTYQYDGGTNGKGQLWKVSNSDVTTTYNAYDNMGRNTTVSKTFAGNPKTYVTNMEYDLSGKLKSVYYPADQNGDRYWLAQEYYPGANLLSKVVGLTDLKGYATYTNYEATGKTGQVNHANGTSKTFTYDQLSTRLYGYVAEKSTQEYLQERTYKYTPAGDVAQIIDNPSGDKIIYRYAYDQQHRLVEEFRSEPTNFIPESYSMDYEYNGDTLHAPDNVVLNYNGNVADYALEYDENGNMIRGFDFSRPAQPMERGYNTTPMEWNAENKPTKIPHSVNGTTSIIYDGDGKRAKKVNGSNITYYVNDYFEETNGTSTMYIFAGSTRVAMIKNDQAYYYHKDHLGSTALITDDSQSIVGSAKTEYTPFGLERSNGGQTVTNYKFTDQEQDTSTGLYNYDARLYDPGLGMFISPDSIVPDYYNPQALNRYAYCLNNPLSYTDPDGHVPIETGADVLSALQSLYNFYKDPSWANAGWLAWDVAATAIPYAPGSYVGKGAKYGANLIEAGGDTIGEAKKLTNGVDSIADASKKVDLSPTANPQRVHGPWTERDLARAAEGKGPLDLIPTKNKAGKEVPIELHHADQMPGAAIHEVPPFHSKIEGSHPNEYNQGVTHKMRQEDAQLHWKMRGKEMGNQ